MSDPLAPISEALQGRYAFERELGRGGMATVYLAQDLRHDRPVALKLLHPELAASMGDDRFQREIRLAARLQHPHILTVLDSGESAGRLWFTMPYVEGESLRDRLRRERQLPVEDALGIAREAADALEYAHRHGVVHRDIKPENILLTDGHALVADFGIARALGGASDEKLTETGFAVGTPAYMSPEQAAGERELDARTDIYSLGVVLYEMIAGQPPFTGPTAQAIAARRLTGDAPGVRELRPSVSEAVEQTIRRAMARVPADRFSSAAELGRALAPSPPTPSPTTTRASELRPPRQRSAAILVIGFLLGLGVLFGWLRKHGAADPTSTGAKRLAVLPFDNLGAQDDQYFADGMTDEVRGKLAALPGLQVIANRSAAEYKGTSKSYQEIGQELGVEYLLVGKVRWEKQQGGQSRVRVSPELIDVASSSTRWQQPFDAVLSDVFEVQGKIAGEVASALDLALGAPEREQLENRPTRNLAAYDAFLRGEEASRQLSEIEAAAVQRAAEAYERAVALDSTFTLAWAHLSRARSSLYVNGIPTAQGAEQARKAAERALALDPDGAEGRIALGTYYDFVAGDYAKAIEQFSLGQRVEPNNAELLSGAALSEQSLGRWEDALDHLIRAQRLDPRSLITAERLARTSLWLRRHEETVASADRAVALDPRSLTAHQAKVMAFLAQGDSGGARAALNGIPRDVDPTAVVIQFANIWDMGWFLSADQQALVLRLTPGAFADDRFGRAINIAQIHGYRGDERLARIYGDSAVSASSDVLTDSPDDAQRRVLLGLALAYAGRKAEAAREGERGVSLLPISKDAYTGPYLQHQLVRIYILNGETEKALDQLEPLLQTPYYLSPGWLRMDPTFEPLRKNPRFQALVGRAPSTS